MASFTRTIYDTYNNPYTVEVNITESIPTDYITNNVTNISGSLTVSNTGSGGAYNNSSTGMQGQLTFKNGTSSGAQVGYVTGNTSYDFQGSSTKTATVISFSNISIPHNDDGSFTLYIDTYLKINGTSLGQTISGWGNTIPLTDIPRAPLFEFVYEGMYWTNTKFYVPYQSGNTQSIDEVEVVSVESMSDITSPTFVGYYTDNPLTIENLQPKTTYNFGFRGKNNTGGWQSTTERVWIQITTDPNPVTITNFWISFVQDDYSKVILGAFTSSQEDTNKIEYSVYDATGTNIVWGPYELDYGSNPYVEGLLEETPYCAKARANTNGSNQTWSEYSILNFTTLADQASIYRNNNGTWTKGKGYIDTGSSYEKAQKVYIKINGTWTAGINT